MKITNVYKIIIGLLVIVLLGIGIVYERRHSSVVIPRVQPIERGSATTTTTTGSGYQLSTQGSGSYTIEQVPVTEGRGVPQPIPDLKRVVVFGSQAATLSADAKQTMTAKIVGLQAQLLKNPGYIDAWMDLGMYQSEIGDYDGAKMSWEYTAKLDPKNYVGLMNIANMYVYNLKNMSVAEGYYKQAILRAPTEPNVYIRFAQAYIDLMQDKTKAIAVIDQGLKTLPNNPFLLEFKKRYQ
jgi:hypothetical protein